MKRKFLIKKRDNHKCVICGCKDKLEVHHVKPKSEGGSNNVFNLVTLCKRCHKIIHKKNTRKENKMTFNYLKNFIRYSYNIYLFKSTNGKFVSLRNAHTNYLKLIILVNNYKDDMKNIFGLHFKQYHRHLYINNPNKQIKTNNKSVVKLKFTKKGMVSI